MVSSSIHSPENFKLIQLGIKFGAHVQDSGTLEQLQGALWLGNNITTRLQAVGGNTGWTLEQLEQAEKPNAVPQMPTMSVNNISDKSASVNWTPDPYDKPKITGFHFVLKNLDSSQTIIEDDPLSGVRNSYATNLESGTNYKGYLIAVNAIGNSLENSIEFKTTGIKVEPEPTYDFIIEPEGMVRMFRIGAVEYTEIKIFPESVQSIIDRNIGRLLTPQERAIPYPRPEPITYCVNVYTLDSGGNVLSDHNDSINATKFQQLKNEGKYVFLCEDGIIPTEQQVRDHYGYAAPVADSSINSMMISQSVGAFILKDGRLKGEILYIANTAFNSFYYGKNLTSLVQIKSKTGIPIAVKPNNLNFTNTQRDERIQIDEAVGNFKELIVDFFVWKSTTDLRQFSADKQIQVVEELPPPDEPDFKPCPIGYHKDFNGNCVQDDPEPEIPRDKLIDTLKGFLFGTIALSLLARKY